MSVLLRKYATGTGADVIIPIVKAGSNDFAVSGDWTPAAGDVKVSKDGGASANIATLPTFVTDIGWQFVFSDAELTAARINVNVVDSATKAIEDQHIVIETYGNASAQHAFDLDTANVTLASTTHTGAVIPTVTTVGTTTTNTDMRGTDGALAASSAPTNFADLSITSGTGLVSVGTNNDKTGYSISGTKTTLDALNDVTTAQVNTEVDTALSDYDPPTRAELTTDTNSILTVLGTPAGADVAADIAAVKAETATIVADTNELQTDWVNGGRLDLIVDAILADTASLDGTKIPDTISLANINAEVDTALDTAIPELGVAAPTATPTVRTGLMLMYMMVRNQLIVQTSGTDAIEVYNDAGTKITQKLITDDGSDYTEAEMS